MVLKLAKRFKKFKSEFENDVNMYGTQTNRNTLRTPPGLRMM